MLIINVRFRSWDGSLDADVRDQKELLPALRVLAIEHYVTVTRLLQHTVQDVMIEPSCAFLGDADM